MKKSKETQSDRYTAQIMLAISTMLEEDSENPLDMEKIQEGDNMTDFMHALANVVPTLMYNKFTGNDINMLQFNHIANQLVFQNAKKDE